MPKNEAVRLASVIADELRNTYSIRLPVRGVFEFVSRERLVRAIAHVLELEAR